jgi:hypothetical protein
MHKYSKGGRFMSLLLEQDLRLYKEKKLELQKDAAKWLSGVEDDYTHAVTLTFPFIVKDELEADRYIGKFAKHLNKKCFRRAKCDADKLKMAIVFEGINRKQHIHAHCAIRSPSKFDFGVFESLIKIAWGEAVKSNQAISDVKEYKNNGWIGYCTKQLTITKTSGISQHCNF